MSKLRGVKPTTVEKRLKALFYGQAGSGKTTASISFPKVYLIDTEKGSVNDQYTEKLEKGGGVVFHSSDFDEIVQEVKSLLTEKHDFKTLVIDPVTTVYNSLLDSEEKVVGSDFGRHYNAANKKFKQLLNFILRLDMNVIITSHSKNEYGQNLSILGQTFDGYKKLDYVFDLVLEIQKRNKKRFAIVKKTRVTNFEDDESFEWSYKTLTEKYGKDVLERDAVKEELATPEQTVELKRLIELFKVPQETLDKWLDKSNSSIIEEMPMDIIQKCIDSLKKNI